MPEQPPDPLHYEMKIPPEPRRDKPQGPEKSPSDQKESESSSARDAHTKTVRRDDRTQSGRGKK